jgi:integrase/recombinase XerD
MHVSSAIPGTEVPDVGLLAGYRRPKPFVFTLAEVAAILEAAASSGPTGSFLRVTLPAVLGLMACTGLRVSEALKLNREHVMPKGNPKDLLVLETKFHKSRLVPLHSTTAKQLSIYAGHRELLGYSRHTSAFFVSDYGRRLTQMELLDSFRRIVDALGIRARDGGKRPTLQSLRHTFAVTRLRTWHEANVDVRSRLIHLSTYLGHADVRDTYWYLSATPELLSAAGARFSTGAPK